MKREATFGSISEATMRPEDLIPSFAWELDYLSDDPNHAALVAEAEALELDDSEFPGPYYKDEEAADDVLAHLFDALNELAPPYGYFGASEGDGASYGFWVFWDSLEDIPKVSDPNELDELGPDDSEALFVNDHGNATLFARQEDGTWKEVWRVV